MKLVTACAAILFCLCVVHVRDWVDEFHYRFPLYITRRIARDWDTFHTAALYRGFRRNELEVVFRQAGFANTTWIFPTESGLYQPILTAQTDMSNLK